MCHIKPSFMGELNHIYPKLNILQKRDFTTLNTTVLDGTTAKGSILI